MTDFQWIGAYDLRRKTATYSAANAHAMVNASRKQPEPKDITRKQAEKIAADHGLLLLGSKPWLRLMKGNVLIETGGYKLISHNAVKHYCEQIYFQEQQALLDAKSDEEIRTEAAQAKALIF
jgi:hypothetical protein